MVSGSRTTFGHPDHLQSVTSASHWQESDGSRQVHCCWLGTFYCFLFHQLESQAHRA
jgi:hypothetical protein